MGADFLPILSFTLNSFCTVFPMLCGGQQLKIFHDTHALPSPRGTPRLPTNGLEGILGNSAFPTSRPAQAGTRALACSPARSTCTSAVGPQGAHPAHLGRLEAHTRPLGGGKVHGLGDAVAAAHFGHKGAREADDELAALLHRPVHLDPLSAQHLRGDLGTQAGLRRPPGCCPQPRPTAHRAPPHPQQPCQLATRPPWRTASPPAGVLTHTPVLREGMRT